MGNGGSIEAMATSYNLDEEMIRLNRVFLSSFSKHAQKSHSFFVKASLVLALICGCTLSAQFVVDERRNHAGLGRSHL